MTTTTFFTPVQDLITKVEARMRAQANEHHGEMHAALQHLLASGGKRIRPAVALLTGGMLGGDKDKLVTLAAAIELLHTATLVHDDLIDGSLLRRGTPTINANWSPAATVLTGDFIFARAAKLASETDSVAVMQMFSETLAVIVSGELAQMFESRWVASRSDYYQRIYAKTASMFELATGAAALLSPVNEDVVKEISRFGVAIGNAFQIVDDVLDFTGEQASVGKPVASDLRQGLITLPALLYFESHPDDPDMLAITNGSRSSEERLLHLVDSIRQSGAIEQSLAEANGFIDTGLEILSQIPASSQMSSSSQMSASSQMQASVERTALEDLAKYIVSRQR